MKRAVHSEIIKLRSTKSWWLTGIGALALTAIALTSHLLVTHFGDLASTDPAQRSPAALAAMAATIYTSGQFSGVLLVLLLGTGLMTNEYAHRTATSTFLATPRRSRVILAKLVVGAVLGFGLWLLSTVISIAVGVTYLHGEGLSAGFGRPGVVWAVLLNLAAYVLWAGLGVGLGVLVRSRTGSAVTAILLYLLGFIGAALVFDLIHTHLIKHDWMLTAQVIVPSMASSVMTSPGGHAFAHAPAQWVGALVLIGYGLLAGVIGTGVVRRQDIG